MRLTVLVPASQDGTDPARWLAEVGPALAPLAEVEIRPVPQPRRRYGAGVVDAAGRSGGDWLVVVDSTRHPPQAVAELARTALRHDADIVVATRYAGSTKAAGSAGSAGAPGWATRAVKAVFPRLLATVSDPLSGLFAFRRSAVDLDRLRPTGSRILLEVLVRHPATGVTELAYQDPAVTVMSLGERLGLVRHVSRLRRHRLSGQLRAGPGTAADRLRELGRMLGFGMVGLTGMVVNTAALWLFFHVIGVHHLLGAALATQVSTSWNFLLLDRTVYRRDRSGTWRARAARFLLLNNLLLVARLPMLQALVWSGIEVLTANAATLVALFLVRFLVSDRAIYRNPGTGRRAPVRLLVARTAEHVVPAPRRRTYLDYRYHVGGLVSIGSQIPLPELEYFRAQWVDEADVDITLRVGAVGGSGPRRRAGLTEYSDPATLRYEEHLGRRGANFRIELGRPINVVVGPLLGRSPHVAYTNVVEGLLRFVLASRGRMLLHSACVNLDGVGVMLSALTDTGKTATVLRLLREHGGTFLSDDMTIIDAGGEAYCFPKPLTVSAHTLRAISGATAVSGAGRAGELTRAQWRTLQLRSRLHSRAGRSFALRLSRFNLPILALNAVVQLLVPPPKYHVGRLVSCRIDPAVRVSELFVIEAGAPGVAELDHATTVDRLLRNTDDAYGFPPFRYLAPAITLGGDGYTDLLRREREVLSSFVSHVRCRSIASDCYGWSDEIARLLPAARLQT